jgi:hypothetical protein
MNIRHVQRIQDKAAHVPTRDCPCQPRVYLVDVRTGAKVWEHRLPTTPAMAAELGQRTRP